MGMPVTKPWSEDFTAVHFVVSSFVPLKSSVNVQV
jgi:hypothetical protein